MAHLIEVVLAIASIMIAAEVVAVLRLHLPTTLHVATDIIGYPTFHAFDGEEYLETFYLVVLAGPLLAILLFFVLSISAARVRLPLPRRGPVLPCTRFGAQAAIDQFTMNTSLWGRLETLGLAVGRIGAVGAVLGAELAIHRGRVGSHFWIDVVEGAVVYACGVAAACGALVVILRRRRGHTVDPRVVLPAVNAIGASLPVAGLALVASITQVTTMDDHTVHIVPWLDTRLAALGTVLVAAAVARAVVLGRSDVGRTHVIERRAILLVTVPILIFIGLATLPGTISPFLIFEHGQQLATLRMIQAGDLPWRDFIGAHGLLEDTFRLVPGAFIFGQTYWGANAGFVLLVVPLQFIAIYFLAYRVFGRMTAALLAVACYFFHTNAILPYTRFMFWPLLLVLFLATLDRRSSALSFAVGVGLVGYNVIAPETAYCVVAVGVALVCRDIYFSDWQPGRRLASFRMTIWFGCGLVLSTAIVVAVLGVLHGLRGLVIYYTSNVSGHNLEGRIPLLPLDPPYRTWVYAPAVGILIAIGIVAVKLRLRSVLASRDFAMIAAAVVTVLYYEKFTDRADFHVQQVYGVAVPLFLLVARALLDVAEGVVSKFERRRSGPRLVALPVGMAVLVGAVLTSPVPLTSIASHSAERYRATAAEEPWWPSLGYAARQDEVLYSDMKTLLGLYTVPGERVFDFANEPGLLYWVENVLPSTRYYTVAVAMPQAAQRELVSELASARPKYILYYGQSFDALSVWDEVPNDVRHYDVSQYILDHYHPVLSLDTQILYAINGAEDVPYPGLLRGKVQGDLFTDDVAFRGFSCTWGFSPEYLNVPHPPENESVPVPSSTSAGRTSLSPPPGHVWADYHWIEVQASQGTFSGDTFTFSMANAPGEDRSISFHTLEGSSKVYRFPIAACPQWHGYGGATLQLANLTQQGVTVRVLP